MQLTLVLRDRCRDPERPPCNCAERATEMRGPPHAIRRRTPVICIMTIHRNWFVMWTTASAHRRSPSDGPGVTAGGTRALRRPPTRLRPTGPRPAVLTEGHPCAPHETAAAHDRPTPPARPRPRRARRCRRRVHRRGCPARHPSGAAPAAPPSAPAAARRPAGTSRSARRLASRGAHARPQAARPPPPPRPAPRPCRRPSARSARGTASARRARTPSTAPGWSTGPTAAPARRCRAPAGRCRGSAPRSPSRHCSPATWCSSTAGPSHVAIYMGNGKVVHASNPRHPVKIADLNSMPFNSARRV